MRQRRAESLGTAWDVATWLDVVPAVVILDGLLGAGLVKPDELSTLRAARSLLGTRGAGTAGRALDLADGRSGSAQESRLRVRLVLTGLPHATSLRLCTEFRGIVREVRAALESRGARLR